MPALGLMHGDNVGLENGHVTCKSFAVVKRSLQFVLKANV